MHAALSATLLVVKLAAGTDDAAQPSTEPLLPEGTFNVLHFPPPEPPVDIPELEEPPPMTSTAAPPEMQQQQAWPPSGAYVAMGSTWWLQGAPPVFLSQSWDSVPQGGRYVPWGVDHMAQGPLSPSSPWWQMGAPPLFLNQSYDSIPQGAASIPWAPYTTGYRRWR